MTKDKRPAVYQQDVHLTIRVLVDGTMDGFMVDTDALREQIEQYVEDRLGAEIRPGLDQIYAGRGPSSSRFYGFEDSERVALNREGLHMQLASLPATLR